MTRSTEEWFGRTEDAAIPQRVRLRVWQRDDGRCQCGCNRKIAVGEAWDLDHKDALINGGLHREANLRVILRAHHKIKTSEDVKIKAKVARVRAKHIGIRPRSQFACSRRTPWKKKINGQVERR